MPDRLKKVLKPLLVLLLIVVASTNIARWGSAGENNRIRNRVNHILSEHIADMTHFLNLADQKIRQSATGDLLRLELLQQPLHNECYLTIYSGDSLKYWSSTRVAFPAKTTLSDTITCEQTPGGYYLTITRQSGKYLLKGWVMLQTIYPINNQYLRNSFREEFNINDQFQISTSPLQNGIAITGTTAAGSKPLFYLLPGGTSSPAGGNLLSLTALLLLLIITGSQIVRLIDRLKSNPIVKSVLLLLAVHIIYLLLLYLLPYLSAGESTLFSPVLFAMGRYLPSLGFFLISSILMLTAISGIYNFFRSNQTITTRQRRDYTIFLILLLIIYLAVTVWMMQSFINNSTLTLEIYTGKDFISTDLPVLISLSIQILGVAILLVRIKRLSSKQGRQTALMMLLALPLLLLFFKLFAIQFQLYPILFYLILTLLFWRIRWELIAQFKLSSLLFFGVIGAIYTSLLFNALTEERTRQQQKLTAINLATERDPAAEIFLTGFESRLRKDSLLTQHLTPPYTTLNNYLQTTYFNGFWKKYEMLVTVCHKQDALFLADNSNNVPCFEFFDNLKKEKGMQIGQTNFYFMDRLNGRISYLGEISSHDNLGQPIRLFVELHSRRLPDGKGYPQLLLDGKIYHDRSKERFSYAKYFEGILVDKGGKYSYPIRMMERDTTAREFHFSMSGGYNHCQYKKSSSNYVIVSYPEQRWIERGKSFPSLFLAIYLIGIIWLITIGGPTLTFVLRPDFKEKIQITLLTTLLLVLLLTGLGLVQYNYREFRKNLIEELQEKARSIAAEMSIRIGQQEELGEISDYLNEQLEEISGITWVDINLYNREGRLVASSRNELFNQQISSRWMNPEAFHQLHNYGSSSYLGNENLGSMNFFSIYAPVYNMEDKPVGYINLPYFNRQDEFDEQVSSFYIAFMNLYIFLIILSLIVALIISARLTSPLLKIEENLRSIELGKVNAKIDYQSDDEIGRLAKEYNKKVDELAESARLLAQSERESAWREMARQIAHEINNPLTPMKLNMQYLQKMKSQDSADFDRYFEQVSKSLITQIESLSAIAASFSDFARMNSPRVEQVDLKNRLQHVVTLFGSSPDYDLTLHLPEETILIAGDQKQLDRALVNLLTNAAQSFVPGKRGTIDVALRSEENKSVITITDNGTGIPEENRERLFDPNFTTKNSGMGLGLAITRRIIENMKGTIRFESEMGKGTTFIIEF